MTENMRRLAHDLAQMFGTFTKSSHTFYDGRSVYIVAKEVLEHFAASSSFVPSLEDEAKRYVSRAAPADLRAAIDSGDALLVDWERETADPIAEMDAIYTEYAKSFGRFPDAEMQRVVRKSKEMLMDWWSWHRETIRDALDRHAAAQLAAVAAPEARIETVAFRMRSTSDMKWILIDDVSLATDMKARGWEVQPLVHPAVNDSPSALRAAPLSEPCALDQGARPVWLSDDQIIDRTADAMIDADLPPKWCLDNHAALVKFARALLAPPVAQQEGSTQAITERTSQ